MTGSVLDAETVLVSAIVAAYNEERRVKQCLESLLAQTYPNLEVILADDGSNDATCRIASAFPAVRVFAGVHSGKARTVNGAAARARGSILLFLDADMFFDADYVARLVAPIRAGGAIGSCHGTEHVANPDNPWSKCWQTVARLPLHSRLALTDEERRRGSIIYRAVLTEPFLRVSGFDDTGYSDDQTLCAKLGQPAVFVPDAVCYHYNLESLAEVFGHGAWGGKTIFLKYGSRALISYSFPFSVAGALRRAVRFRMLALIPYTIASDAGVFWSLLKRTLRIDRGSAR